MDYSENFHGIQFCAKRGEELEITASADDFYIAAWNGVLNIMNKGLCGRTAVFVDDCSFFSQTESKITVKVIAGTGSYMKELNKIAPVSKHEFARHNLGRLW